MASKAVRKNKKRYDTSEVQDNSYVIFKMPSVYQANVYRKQISDFFDTIRIARDKDAGDFVDETEKQELIDKIEDLDFTPVNQLFVDVAVEFFDSWNWVDDNGDPLQGLEELDPFEDLTNSELDIITKCAADVIGLGDLKDTSIKTNFTK